MGRPVLASLVLAVMLAALSAVDITSYRLPDVLTLPLIVAGIAVSALLNTTAPPWWFAVSAGINFLVMVSIREAYRYVRGRAGLGLGDAKLFAAAGAWLGAEALPSVLLIAAVTGLVCVLVAVSRGYDMARTTRVPFGPFLALAMWCVWIYGPV